MLVEVEGNGRKRQNNDAYTLHKPVRLNFRRRMTFTIGIDNLWQIFQNCQSINPNAVKSFYRFITKNYSISIAVPPASVATNLMLGGTLVESMLLDWKVVGSNPAPVVLFFYYSSLQYYISVPGIEQSIMCKDSGFSALMGYPNGQVSARWMIGLLTSTTFEMMGE